MLKQPVCQTPPSPPDRAHTAVSSWNSGDSTKKKLVAKMIHVGSSTLLSRLTGLIREFLLSRFLGVGEMADAFFTALKIPNSLRKIFAEGALSAACIPTFVAIIKRDSKKTISSLMMLLFLTFEGALILLCGLIFWKADIVIYLIASGWYLDGVPGIQVAYAISYLRFLISLIVFFSSSSLLAGALQSVNHFFIPAISSVLFNGVLIGGLAVCIMVGASTEFLCLIFLIAGLLQFCAHVVTYFKLHFTLSISFRAIYPYFKQIVKKFLPCLLSMSILELNLFISTSLATYLPEGSIALLYYTNRFMGIPLGVFTVTFATIFLPFFSRIGIYAPRRLSVYLLESTKIIFWVTMPCTFVMSFLSEKIFYTIFLSDKFSIEHVHQASALLTVFLMGLFFFSLYKILLNMYYALHDTITPCYISIAVLLINYALGKLLASFFGVIGLATAFVLTNVIHVCLFALFLYVKFDFKLYIYPFVRFMGPALLQLSCATVVFVATYCVSYYGILYSAFPALGHFLLFKVGLWLWVGPLCLCMALFLIKTRKFFNVRLYFLD